MGETNGDGAPLTVPAMAQALRTLGLAPGDLVMVHASLSSLGYVVGGAESCIRALLQVLGPQGTLAMPGFSGETSDPADWTDPPFAPEHLELVRDHVPVFEPAITPTLGMGAIAEAFRTWPGVVRSPHPQVSVCALGPLSERLCFPHDWAWGEGAGSPFERLCTLGGRLLLLGVGFNRATLLHYAESRVPHGRRKTRRFPARDAAGRRYWAEAPDVGDDLNTHFPAIGQAARAAGLGAYGRVGAADCTLVEAAALADVATDYLSAALRPEAG